MKELKVCNVDEEGRFGGPERRILQVAVALARHGINTHVVCSTLNSETFVRNLARAKVTYSALPITRLSMERRILVRYVFRFPYEIFLLAIFFRRQRTDIVHVNGSYQFKIAIAAFISSKPIVWHLNDTRMNPLVYLIFRKLLFRLADGFIVAGQKVSEYYLDGLSLKGRPVTEIHAPVDVSVFKPSAASSDVQKEGIVISTVSGINPDKGVEYFIRMCAAVGRIHENVKFFIAGAQLDSQKEYARSIFSLIKELDIPPDRLEFVGLVDDVPGFLDKSDICVFTSINEASPTSVWEALSMGKPVVSTDVGSVSQHIQDGVSGYVVPVKDVDAICDRVFELINNSQARIEMGKKAREVAESRLDISACAQLHSDIYQSILSSKL